LRVRPRLLKPEALARTAPLCESATL
jgi:hypothetical protein